MKSDADKKSFGSLLHNKVEIANISAIALTLIIYLICALVYLDDYHYFHDTSSYIFQAQHVAEWLTGRQVNDFPLLPVEDFTGTKYVYLWGTPIVYGLAFSVFGPSFYAAKLTNVAAMIAISLMMLHKAGRKTPLGFILMTATLFHPLSFKYTNMQLTEVHFTAVSLACLFGFDRLLKAYRASEGRKSVLLLSTMCVVIFMPMLLRQNGITVVVAGMITFVVYLMHDNNRRVPELTRKSSLGIAGCLTMLFLLWFYYIRHQTGMATKWPFSIANILPQLSYYFRLMAWEIGIGGLVGYAIACGFIAFTLLGMFLGGKRELPYALFALLTVLLYLLNEWQQGIRYLYPILPLSFYFCCIGFLGLWKSMRQKERMAYCIIAGATVIHLVLVWPFYLLNHLDRLQNIRVHKNPHTAELLSYLSANREHVDFIYAQRMSYRGIPLHTGIKTKQRSAHTVADLIESGRFKDKAVFISSKNHDSDVATIMSPDIMQPIWQNDRYVIFEIRK